MPDNILSLKVAARFAARPMKEEKIKALLLKLRKGSGTSIKCSELDQVLAYLGGWKIEEDLLWVPQGGGYTPADEPKRSGHNQRSVVEDMWRTAKDNEVRSLPDPGSKPKYTMLYQDVGEIQERGSDYYFFEFRAWRNEPGIRVISPERETWEWPGTVEKFLNDYATNFGRAKGHKGLLEWLFEDTTFLKQVNEKLGMPSYEQEKEQKRRDKAPRVDGNMGTCPCCFGTFKLVPKTKEGKDKTMPGMVLHGYKRPGTGTIQGNCWGQDWPPFELSSEGTVAFLAALKRTENEVEDFVRRLKSGPASSFHVMDGKKLREVTPDDPEYPKLLKNKTEETEQRLSNLRLTIGIVKRNLDGWTPQPLPEAGTPMRYPTL